MAAVGGDIIEISYKHPTVGSGLWFLKSNEDSTFNTGGIRAVDDDNMIDGGGNEITQLNRVRWSLECTISWDMNISDEATVAAALAASPVATEFTVTHINGTIWVGTGRPVGDINGNGNGGTLPIKLAGGGRMKQI